MFHNTYQAGFLSILYSIGSKPLQIWDSKVQNGQIQRITDEDIQSSVLEIVGTNVSTNYIHCPGDPKKTLGIRLPYLVLILKNLEKYFTFEVQVLDDKNIRRRFRASTFQSCTRVEPFICTMPMKLDEGWNQIQFNLADFTRRAYGTNYIETLRVQVHANCRLRRIYFSDRLYSEEELPASFKVFLPTRNQPQPQPQHHHHHHQLMHHSQPRIKAQGGGRPRKQAEKAEMAQQQQQQQQQQQHGAAVMAAEEAGEEKHGVEPEVIAAVDAAAVASAMAAPPLEDEDEAIVALNAATTAGIDNDGLPIVATEPDKEATGGDVPVGAS